MQQSSTSPYQKAHNHQSGEDNKSNGSDKYKSTNSAGGESSSNAQSQATGNGSNLNGLDWKITMLDGTQTVELNMPDEMGKQKKTHVCLFCGKIYNRKYGLKIHLRTHTGYKPLKCKVCARPFSDPSNLNKHVRLHSQGETPYRCPYCGKILVRKRDLDRHIISRHASSAVGKDMEALASSSAHHHHHHLDYNNDYNNNNNNNNFSDRSNENSRSFYYKNDEDNFDETD
jgi:uncharacterized C2H2 Zn-finger protein